MPQRGNFDPQAFRNTYNATEAEVEAADEYANAAVEYNAAALGGSFIRHLARDSPMMHFERRLEYVVREQKEI